MNLIQEQTEIKNGLLYFWDCKVCHRLGWDKQHNCPANNSDCGIFLYDKLKEHFEAIYKNQWKVEASK